MSSATSTYAVSTSNIYMSVTINGTQYPITLKRGVQFLAIENIKQTLPTFQLVVDDVGQQLNNSVAINDGSTIEVTVGTSKTDNITCQFVAFGKPARIPSKEMPGAYTYHIQGICKAVAMSTARPDKPIKGTSKDVFATAASKFGLNFLSSFNANDTMVWLPSNMSWLDFLHHTSNHAYESDNSVSYHSIDCQNNLHFHNAPNLMKGGVKCYIYNKAVVTNVSPRFACIYYKHISRAGQENHKAVYGAETYQPQADGTTTSHKKATTSLLTDVIDAGKAIKKEIESVPKMLFAPVDCGNNHSNYIAARHQNYRLRSVYNQHIYVGLAQFSGLSTYDVVYFSSTDENGNIEQDITGKYMVSAITRFVAGGLYFEKIELVSSGMYSGDNTLI